MNDLHNNESDILSSQTQGQRAPTKNASSGKAYFDGLLKRIKERKKKGHVLSDEECQERARLLVENMISAAEKDIESMKQSKPAIAKLGMLKDAIEASKPAWRHFCVSEGVAEAMASWITILPDGSLPSLTVRTAILNLAQQLPLQESDLRDNNLGRAIIALWNHPDETDENRAKIRQLIQRWVRPMLGLATSYVDIQRPSGSLAGEKQGNKANYHLSANAQDNNNLTFSIQPRGLDIDGISEQQSGIQRMSRLKYNMDPRKKIPSRAAQVVTKPS
ncbi:Protein IWS1 homolog A [Babesia microti strain RI]|uniref:Protein IWS1 homolog A n=1 Tax=Babesia microti (strain RI) TaxID=1133968 RepID=A0A1R4ABT0_BABMR|nr:Protein IWS1 homolog A [Babesia microti strain RI]SJK86456.1 Protein IWS1 homolog A [Babesia microti strain RI]|eukprot:XP_021338613.1 Protein IWS1 homolog A [Babesia microti strain RI]